MPSNPIRLGIPARVWHFLRVHATIVIWVLEYLVVKRAWFVAPLVLLLMAVGLLIFATANPVVSPFLYALF